MNISHFWMWTLCRIQTSFGVCEWALVGINEGKMFGHIGRWFEWITGDTMLGVIEGWFEFTSLGISELAAEVQKEKLLFGINDINKEGDKQWATVGSTDKQSLCI